MRYKVRYIFEGTRGRMNYLRPGDVLEIVGREPEPIETKILWVVNRNEDTIYGTSQGIIYARELERIR